MKCCVTAPFLKVVCITAVALPVGLHLASHFTSPHLIVPATTPVMAVCATHHPPVSEIVARADEYYDNNQMREGLKYMTQYEDLDEVEVRDHARPRLCRAVGGIVHVYRPLALYITESSEVKNEVNKT